MKKWTPARIKAWRERHKLSQCDAAQVVRKSRRWWQGLESGEVEAPHWLGLMLEDALKE